jgi:hypothetical protein
MPIEKTNLVNAQESDAETMLDHDNMEDIDLMREYSKQLNGDVEEQDDINSEPS